MVCVMRETVRASFELRANVGRKMRGDFGFASLSPRAVQSQLDRGKINARLPGPFDPTEEVCQAQSN